MFVTYKFRMEALLRRQEICSIVLPDDQEVQERWKQFGVLAFGGVTYWFTHKALGRGVLRNRPFIPQFIAIVPAISAVYVGGLYVRFKTLKREGLLS